MGNEAWRLDGKDEIVGRLVGPARKSIGGLQAVESAVDLDGREDRAGMCQFALVRQVFGIEGTAPWCIGPAGYPDPNLSVVHGHSSTIISGPSTWVPARSPPS